MTSWTSLLLSSSQTSKGAEACHTGSALIFIFALGTGEKNWRWPWKLVPAVFLCWGSVFFFTSYSWGFHDQMMEWFTFASNWPARLSAVGAFELAPGLSGIHVTFVSGSNTFLSCHNRSHKLLWPQIELCGDLWYIQGHAFILPRHSYVVTQELALYRSD